MKKTTNFIALSTIILGAFASPVSILAEAEIPNKQLDSSQQSRSDLKKNENSDVKQETSNNSMKEKALASGSVIDDDGLKSLINTNLWEDNLESPISQAALENLSSITWNRVTVPIVINDFTGLHYATSLRSFGSKDAMDSMVTINNLDSLVSEANQMPNLKEIAFSYAKNLTNISPLANLTNISTLRLNLKLGEDYSSFSRLLSLPGFRKLQLVNNGYYISDGGGADYFSVQHSDYIEGQGIELKNPFTLPEGINFDFNNAKVIQGSQIWSLQNGHLVRNHPEPTGTEGLVVVTVPIVGSNVDKLDLSDSRDGSFISHSLNFGIPYTVINSTTVNVHDSQMYADQNGDHSWRPEKNFDSATAADGTSLDYDGFIAAGGTVDDSQLDTSTPGVYPVTYTLNGVTSTAHITVLENHLSLTGDNLERYVGDPLPEDSAFNAVGIDYDGASLAVSIDKSKVDMSKAGQYPVRLSMDPVAIPTISYYHDVYVTVKDKQTAVNVHDSTIYVGDAWKAEDNFDSAIDKDGNPIDFSKVTVDDSQVDTSKAGTYAVKYSYDGVESTATVTVKDKQTNTTHPDKPSKDDNSNHEDSQKPKNKSSVMQVNNNKSDINALPETGELSGLILSTVGALILALIGLALLFKRKVLK